MTKIYSYSIINKYLIVGKHLLTTFLVILKSLKGTINNLRQLLLWNCTCTLISNSIYFKNLWCFHDFNDTKFFLNVWKDSQWKIMYSERQKYGINFLKIKQNFFQKNL
jgi:hypothetical protein